MDIKQVVKDLLGKIKGGKGAQPPEVDKSVLLEKIAQADLFKYLKPEHMEKLFEHMETINLLKGSKIIKEGDEGDYYYLLVSGTATVTRLSKTTGKPEELAKLTGPAGFGEDALISNAKRNATITTTSDSVVMRLSKDAFNDYVKAPAITWLPTTEARRKVSEGGAKWIDVRDADEVARGGGLPGALAIPLGQIRHRLEELSIETAYVCYCQNGRLSSTAAFLLGQRGYNVAVMRGGLKALNSL